MRIVLHCESVVLFCILYLHRKFSFNSANIFLPHLSCSDLSLHLPSFARISPEHQQSRGETVQSRRRLIIMIYWTRSNVFLVVGLVTYSLTHSQPLF